MSTSARKCPKCNGEMVLGHSTPVGGVKPMGLFWREGPPKKSWLDPRLDQVATPEFIPIAHFRCSSCGFLESYARLESALE
jgi:hypothetical protein